MSLVEYEAGRPQVNRKLVHLAFLHEDFTIETFSETRSNRRVEHQPFSTVRIDIPQFPHPVCIRSVAFGPQLDENAASHLNRRRKNGSDKFQNVFSIASCPLVHR